jgi:Holliday junction resolvase RusA-like endonuclease
VRQSFSIPWEPTAKGRPKFVRASGVAYTPAPTRHAEGAIKLLLSAQSPKLYEAGVPLSVQMTFWVTRPQSAPKRVLYPAKRPDLDQYVKLLLDAASGLLWLDDAQVVEIVARKRFSDAAPRQDLAVEEA